MSRKKKKRHNKQVSCPVKAHRNKVLNRDLDQAYNKFCGSSLHLVLQDLESRGEEDVIARGYFLALQIEIANRRAKKHTGDIRLRLYNKKVALLSEMVSHCQGNGYKIEQAVAHDVGGPGEVMYVYLPGCEQISWHCNVGRLALPEATQDWDEKKFSTLRKLEEGLMKEFYSDGVPVAQV